MPRYWKKRHKKPRNNDRDEFIKYLPAVIIFVIVLVVAFAWNFITNCIIEWPIRWDIGMCWNEQKEPSVQKAANEAIKFIP